MGDRTGRDGGRVRTENGKATPLVGDVWEYGVSYGEAMQGGGG